MLPGHVGKNSLSVAILALKNLILLLRHRCRHAAIAKFFGDAIPQCNKYCDHCKNPAAVKKQVEALERSSSSWNRSCIGPSASSWNDYDSDLYEGGRRGFGGFSRYEFEKQTTEAVASLFHVILL